MPEYTALRITRANPDRWAADGDRYWLRFLQEQEDDKITYTEVAEVIDTLYDIDPCIEQAAGAAPEVAPITPEKLYESAAEVFGYNMAACRTALSGEYIADIKVIRSHPLPEQNEPYQLVLSAGTVQMTRKVQEQLTLDLDVSGTTSIDLDWPIVGRFSGTWLGTVIGETGVIYPPAVTNTGNTVHWEQIATGTLRVTFDTEYDLLTIQVPGVPDSEGSDTGKSQGIKLLAFYHMLIFTGDLAAPEQDPALGVGALRQLCGYMTLTPGGLHVDHGGGTTVDDDDEPAAEPGEPEYGCQDENEYYGLSSTYEKICCNPPPWWLTPESCLLRTARNSGGMDISDEDREAILEQYPTAEFIPVGPDGAEGCGTITWQLDIAQKSCCGEVPPLEWNKDLSAEVIAPSSFADVYVSGGTNPIKWQVRGKGCWVNQSFTQRDITTSGDRLRVYTDSTACGVCQVTADDGCTTTKGKLRVTAGQWVLLKDVSGWDLRAATNWILSGQADNSINTSGNIVNTIVTENYKLEETIRAIPCGSGCHPINLGDGRCACAEDRLEIQLAAQNYNYGLSGEDRLVTGGLYPMQCFDLEKCTFAGFGEPLTCEYYCWPCEDWLVIMYFGGGQYTVYAIVVNRRRLWEWVCP